MKRRLAIAACAIAALFAIVAAWDYLAARHLSAAVEKIRVAGEPVYSDLYNLRPQTNEQKLASQYYVAAGMLVRDGWGKRFSAVDAELEAVLASRPAVPPPALMQTLARVVEEHGPFYAIFDRAASLDAHGLAYGDEPRFAFADRSYATVNGLRVAHLSLLGRSSDAVRALRSTIALTRVSSHLWKVGIDPTRDLELLLTYAPPSAAELGQLQAGFQAMSIDDDVSKAMLIERARFITMVWPVTASPPASTPRIREARYGSASVIDWFLRPLSTMRVRETLATFEEAKGPSSQPWPSKFDAVAAFSEKYPLVPVTGALDGGLRRYFRDLFRTGGAIPRSFVAQSLGAVTANVARDLTSKGLAVTALAVERYRRDNHGSLPPTLDAIVPWYLDAVPIDPRSGAPLRYLTRANGYAIYSIGANRIDDGGDRTPVTDANAQPAALPTPKDIVLEVRTSF